ncbi:hypothetical protein B0I32_106116 [Nonomuraea fuscirosea]|uniref:Uncharacterized protein n=1 Tax=Nonomuraea fuscirosea TaxID=1291556 RepID=A0A2T0N1W8_9ACTN|nr:hypothetical protein B0I32_106116 [Nonomuraea fuscirosea]
MYWNSSSPDLPARPARSRSTVSSVCAMRAGTTPGSSARESLRYWRAIVSGPASPKSSIEVLPRASEAVNSLSLSTVRRPSAMRTSTLPRLFRVAGLAQAEVSSAETSL